MKPHVWPRNERETSCHSYNIKFVNLLLITKFVYMQASSRTQLRSLGKKYDYTNSWLYYSQF